MELGALGFVPFARPDVPRDLRRADDPPAGILDRRNHQRDRHARPVLVPPDRLHLHGLAGANAGEHPIFLGVSVTGNDQSDVLPDCFGLRVTEHPLGRTIPRRDHAVQTLAHDGIVGRFDDGGDSL